MKQIVDGYLYDTEKATLLYTASSYRRTRKYYVTDKGTYFCFYQNVGEIKTIDESVIKEILAEHDTDKYIELFGAVEEG